MVTWRLDQASVEWLYRKARADRWALPLETFAAALESSARRAFAAESPDTNELEHYLTSLHVEDLALACACAEGSEPAWEHFIREHRPALYRAAGAIDPSGGARDLVDSLYGELFGLSERDGERRSHFRYFHGRSSLTTWLRAVVSQRHVDRLRTVRRLDPLPADEAPGALPSAEVTVDPKWASYIRLMRQAMTAAVAALAPRDRLRVRCYYAQNLTLVQIGRTLGESEATASRHLARTRRDIRAHVERHFRDQDRMSEAEISECFALVISDSGSLDLAELLGSESGSESGSDPTRKKVAQDRSNSKENSRAGRK